MRKISRENQDTFRLINKRMLAATIERGLLIDELNTKIQSLVAEFSNENAQLLEELERIYVDSANKLKELSNEQIDRMEAYMSERSDNWHDGDSGFNYRYWVEEWEEYFKEMDDAGCANFSIEVNICNNLPEPTLPTFKP